MPSSKQRVRTQHSGGGHGVVVVCMCRVEPSWDVLLMSIYVRMLLCGLFFCCCFIVVVDFSGRGCE